jgi:hypothetical protein
MGSRYADPSSRRVALPCVVFAVPRFACFEKRVSVFAQSVSVPSNHLSTLPPHALLLSPLLPNALAARLGFCFAVHVQVCMH